MRLPSTTNGLALAAAVIALVVYLPSLATGYVFDDLMLFVGNPFAHRLSDIPRCFTTHLWDLGWKGEDRALHYYRPLVCATYAANWALGGGKPWAFHLVNVLTHALATFLVARVASRWTRHAGLGFLAALVFALHPSRTENVVWVSGRTDVLMVVFGLTALELAHAAAQARGAGAWARVGAAASSMVLALLCKEPAVVFGVLCWVDVFENGVPAPDRRRAVLPAATLFVVAALYLVARIFYPVGGVPLGFTPLHALFTIGGYLERIAYPWPQTFYHRPLTQTGGVTEYVLLPVALGVIGLVVLAWLLWRVRRSPRLLTLTAAPVLLMLPLLHFVPTGLMFSTSDRFLYLPLALGFIAIAAQFPALSTALSEKRPVRLLAGGILCIWSAIVVVRTADYKDGETFWGRELELQPYNTHALRGLARVLQGRGDVDGAFELVRRSLSKGGYRYLLLDIPLARVLSYAQLVTLAAARTPDGDVEALTHLFHELEAMVEQRPDRFTGKTAGIELSPRPVKAHFDELMGSSGPMLYAEAAFLAARLGYQDQAKRWLARIQDEDLAVLWNVPNFILTYGRLFDFDGANGRLRVAREVMTPQAAADLDRRMRAARSWLERTPRSDVERMLFRGLAHAELGAYLLALREVRPAYSLESTPGDATGLFIQLLVSARLEAEALRVARAAHGEQQGTTLVDAMRNALPPRLRSTPPVPTEQAWWAPPE